MKALVIYDSFFGNTERIAQAIGNALGSQQEVQVIRVGNAQAAQLTELQFLFVGSPTRSYQATPAIMTFLKSIPANSLKGIKVAAFDTRFAASDVQSTVLRLVIRFGRFAAQPIADHLKKKGGNLVLPPEGFIVKDAEGPLKEGELERAADWAKRALQS